MLCFVSDEIICIFLITKNVIIHFMIELVQDMVSYLKKIQRNVHNIKQYTKGKNNGNNVKNNGNNIKNNGNNIKNSEYMKYIVDIANHCYPNENINTSKQLVNYTIQKLAESNNHKAGSMKFIHPLVYVKQVHKKIISSKSKDDCARFKGLVQLFISQLNVNKDKMKGEMEIYKLIDSGNITNNTNVFVKDTNLKLKIKLDNDDVHIFLNDSKIKLKDFRKKYIPRKKLLTQLYVVKNNKKVYLKHL